MKKKYPFNVLSTEVFCKCGTAIKLRLAEAKQKVLDCYQCHIAKEHKRGHVIKRR